ncbi:MAG: tetratricopeptide repeat protein [Candidatus Caenarcaniphilales bacterium]|nr:tetratricopeptide repeat protein [Candidatus Caenarcaniphilales bacterium]
MSFSPRLVSVFTVVVLGVGVIFLPAQAESSKQELNAKATELRLFLGRHPEVPEAHINLGNTYLEEGHDGKPIRHYMAAIKQNPNYAEAYYNLGNVYFKQGEKEQAINAYKKAIEIKPGLAMAYNGLGNAYVDNKQYAAAILSYEKAIQIEPNFREANYNLCAAHLYAKQYAEASTSCERSIKLNNTAKAYNNLGTAYMRTKQYDKAVDAFNRSLSLDPNISETHFNLGAVHLVHHKDKKAAEVELSKLQKLDPQKGHKLAELIKISGL